MTEYSFFAHSDNTLDALVIPDSVLLIPDIDVKCVPEPSIRRIVEDYRIHKSPAALDKARLSIAVYLYCEEAYFTSQRFEQFAKGERFTDQENAIINRAVEKLTGKPLDTDDLRDERLDYYTRAGIPAHIAETHLEMLSRPYNEWHEGDWSLSNKVGNAFFDHHQREEEREKVEARDRALPIIAEEIAAFIEDPTPEQQNESLLCIAQTCIYAKGAFPDFPLNNDDMNRISIGQDDRLWAEDIHSIMAWLVKQDIWEQIPVALEPLLPPAPQPIADIDDAWEDEAEEPEEVRVEWSEAQNLGMSDTEYLAALERGFNPVTGQERWNLDEIKASLSRTITELCMREGVPGGADEFSRLLNSTAVQIADDTYLFPSDRIEELLADSSLTEAEMMRVDTWVENHFGAKLSQFPDIIRQGINPVTLEMLEV